MNDRIQSDDDYQLSRVDEAMRVVRSNLLVALAQVERPIIIITSARPGEGKTFTTVNLARSLALAGRRVILVDLDLRHPDAHHGLRAHNEFGVTDVLLDRRTLDESLQFIETGTGPSDRPWGLYFLGTGPPVNNPAELLATDRTIKLLDELAGQADIVLLDSPPVLPVADTLIISRLVAGAVLVVEARSTSIVDVQQARSSLTRNQARILGVVLNKRQEGDVRTGYGYGYGSPRGPLEGDAAIAIDDPAPRADPSEP